MKSLVRFSFSRFSESYDREAVLQKKAAKTLIDYAGYLKGKGIDLGCGTGFLYRFSSWKNTVGIDISQDMIRFYRKFNKNSVLADMEDLPFKNESFDFAVSNFSIHWSDFDRTFAETRRVLKPDGKFVFNIPVGGSLKAVESILGETQFDFPCVPEILESLKKAGFKIDDFFVEEFEKEFKSGYDLLVHLHKTGVSVNPQKKSLSEKRKIVQKFKDQKKPVILNYKLLFISCFC